ncbi:MAG: glycoside hydrolase family 3 C-terminal domain-containing protein [Muribaculaceae bacterium]|nr:glycoside hydrolase family 3 C-terminal domain-containing protein [Muribaculaceae bacterium]
MQLQNRGVNHNLDGTFHGMSTGTVHEMNMNAHDCALLMRDMQQYLKTNTRLGIPAITCCEGIEGLIQGGCTIFPHALAQASTFNPALIERMTRAAGEEAQAIGIHQILSPVLDIARELRWGRIEETFGEDPYLIAEMATAFINGYQHYDITCTPKHFVAHGSPSGGLNCAGVAGGPRDLFSLYLYPFRKVIDRTAPWSVMSCYSSYDGVPVTGSHYYMTDLLRGDLGFKGYVYSDWGSVERLEVVHHAVANKKDAARKALLAGIDVNIDDAYNTLEEQVKQGLISEADIDRAVRRVLTTKFALGLFDKVYAPVEDVDKVVRSKEHQDIAKEVADESIVMLKNTGILPLNTKACKRIAVVGPNGNQTVMGDYSWVYGDTQEGITLLQGLKNALPKANITYTEGCDWWSQDTTHIQDAVKAVQESDVAIVAIGTRSTYLARNPQNQTSGESFDLSSLELPGAQQQLLEAVKATGKPLVVAFISGKPLAMPWVKENADAVLVQWYGGEKQGQSLADVIVGKVNPSGKLNVSFPRSTGNTPCFYNYNVTDRESIYDGGGSPTHPDRHYIFDKPEALWSFGEGLSYTTFSYEDSHVDRNTYTASDTIIVNVTIKNTGKVAGKEVVQVYVRDIVSSVATPKQQLKAFEKVSLNSGESKNITLKIPVDELALYDEAMRRVVEPGDFEIQVGTASNNIAHRHTITVK